MSFVLRFTPAGMTAAKYDEVIKKLEAAGVGAPKGRSYHISYGPDDAFNVIDIWDSMEEFDAFGNTLLPILNSMGLDPGQPDVQAVHSIVIG